MLRKQSIILLFLVLHFGAQAQQFLHQKINVNSGNGTAKQNAAIYLPAGYTSGKAYPLVIYAHGLGQAGTDVNLLYKTGLPHVLKQGYHPSLDFIMIAVQSPSYSIAPALLPRILEYAQQHWTIDSSRVYLTGIDAGGWAAYGSQLNVNAAFAKKITAIVTIAAATQQVSKAALSKWHENRTPLWAIVGEKDGAYRRRNKAVVQAINKQDAGVATLTTLPGVGHGGWNAVYRGEVKIAGKTIWEWFSEQHRTATFSNAHITAANSGSIVTALVTTTTTSTTTYKNYTLKASGTQIYYPNGLGISGLKGGDTVNIPAGTYTLISLGNFAGASGSPIIIRNKGGKVTTGEIRIANDARYFKLLGNGTRGITYGFKVYRTQYTGITVSKAHDFEIGYCEVSGMTSGFFIKRNPTSTDPSSVYPNYVFKNIYIHHNYVHDVKNEGMYIGHTDPDGGQGGNPLIPVRMQNVEIAYNKVERTGWDGIQLANARSGNKVHHNTVLNYGTANVSGQQAGIQIGSNTNVNIYYNTVTKGTGNGIQVFGYGTISIYNNVIEYAAQDGTTKGRESIYCSPYLSGPEVNPRQQAKIYNNTIRYPQPFGAIRVGGVSGNSLYSIIQYNKLLIVNPPSNWQSIHTYSVVPSSTINGNTLISQ